MDDDPWATDIPDRYQPGQLVKGKVTKITNFGVFVELEAGLEGLLHISELADHKVENPEDVVKVGDEIEVKILRVDADERKIGLSRKRVEWAEDDAGEPSEAAATVRPAATAAGRSSRAASAPAIRPAVQDRRRSRQRRPEESAEPHQAEASARRDNASRHSEPARIAQAVAVHIGVTAA